MEVAITRRPPAETKRRLRSEVGFGCATCGSPLLQYHHIVEFAEDKHHRPEDMLALCPNHNAEVSAGEISEKTQRAWKAEPFNIKRGYADGVLRTESRYVAVEAASNYLVGLSFHLLVDERPLLIIRKNSSGQILLSVDLYDENDTLLVSIIDNEWITGDPMPWDIEYRANWLRVREKVRKISLLLDLHKEVIGVEGDLWRSGWSFGIRGQQITF